MKVSTYFEMKTDFASQLLTRQILFDPSPPPENQQEEKQQEEQTLKRLTLNFPVCMCVLCNQRFR